MKDLKQLELELVSETELLEGQAFEAFVKDQLADHIDNVRIATAALDNAVTRKEKDTIEEYKKKFNKYSPNHSSTFKEYYIEKVK